MRPLLLNGCHCFAVLPWTEPAMADLFKTYAKDYKEIIAEARDKLNKAKSLEKGLFFVACRDPVT
jgi:hypothetical protein